ncbi:MAG: sulfatase [Bacteroidia bacterium]|nr:sulfatase [Bacteroidia bacterium]
MKSLCLLGFAAFSTVAHAQEKPDIILFLADDVSWNDLGCYGNKEVMTPNIDRLASNGIRFTNFFLTASSCSPSRNSIITGRYPHNTGAAELHTEPPLEMVSFTEILKQQGYYTAQAGKFHMGKYALRGFDLTNQDARLNGDGGEELWIKTLQDRPKEKPFMMWYASYDAHRPWGTNEFSGTHNPANVTPPFYLADAKGTKSDLAKYYDEIARFDHNIGLVMDELRKQKVLENTIIVVMADNGRPFPHSKTRVNDRGMKTPFIIYWPKGIGEKERVCQSLVSSIDIAPTLLALASAKIPESVQGVSFKSLLDNPGKSFRNFVFAEHNWHDYEAHERMVRTKDFLYILNSRPQFANSGPADALGSPSFQDLLNLNKDGEISPVQADVFLVPRPKEELYQNTSDPDQLKNLISVPEYQKNLKELRRILTKWMDETGDNIPQNLTKDWYMKDAGTRKTTEFGHRGEMPGEKRHATQNNNKGKF